MISFFALNNFNRARRTYYGINISSVRRYQSIQSILLSQSYL